MGVVVGTTDGDGNGGWTRFTQSDGSGPSGFSTNIIYCSDSLGSDAWDGSQPVHTTGIHGPVKTLIKAFGGTGPGVIADPNNTGTTNGDGTGLGTLGAGNSFALRNGHPDWVLLLGGDTWAGQAIETAFNAGASDNFGRGGFSFQEPMLVACYDRVNPTVPNPGTVPNALIKVPGGPQSLVAATSGRPGLFYLGNGANGFFGIAGADLYCSHRDPSSPDYVGAANVFDNTGIYNNSSSTGGSNFFLIEGCRISYFFSNVAFNYGDHVYIRRNVIRHGYSLTNIRAQGLAIDNVTNLVLQENLMDQNGQFGSLVGGSGQGRNAYIQWNTIGVVADGNISSRSASEGFQFRNGGTIINNFVVECAVGFDIGHFEGQPTLTSTRASYNVIQASTGILNSAGVDDGASPHGWGINLINCLGPGVAVEDNIIAHVKQPTSNNSHAFLADSFNTALGFFSVLTPGSGGTPGTYDNTPVTGTGSGGQLKITIASDGTVHNDGSSVLAAIGNGYTQGETLGATPDSISGLTFRLDTLFSRGVHGVQMRRNIVYDWWDYKADDGSTDGHGAANGFSDAVDLAGANTANYPAPTRTIQTYAATLGLPATLDGFMSAAAGQMRYGWKTSLKANSVNEYIRGGFGVARRREIRSAYSM